jgi:gamma-glutamylcyclotransferase (GGCT)/AIG2-like uncharacterized protein YtfP
MKLFVYQTLRSEKTIHEVLGVNKPEITFSLPGYKKVNLGQDYFTIIRSMIPTDRVKGDLITVTNTEAIKLDNWESKYKREQVAELENEPVYAFVYKGKKK